MKLYSEKLCRGASKRDCDRRRRTVPLYSERESRRETLVFLNSGMNTLEMWMDYELEKLAIWKWNDPFQSLLFRFFCSQYARNPAAA